MKNSLLLLVSVIISILIAEIVVRTFVPVREVGSVLSIQDRELGKRLRPNIRTTRHAPEFTMNFSTNSEGFRGPGRLGIPQPILFLGDSFTMGYGVSDGFEFPALIQGRLGEPASGGVPEVINAGIGGNGNGQWLKFLRRNLSDLDPEIVVLQFMQNDFEDNVVENYFTLAPDGRLIENEVRITWARRADAAVTMLPGVSSSHTYAAIREAYYGLGRARSRNADAESVNDELDDIEDIPNDSIYRYALTKALLAEVIRICQSRDYPLIAVLVGLEVFELEIINGLFNQYHVPTLVIPTREERPDLYFEIDGHWNEKGHDYVAGRVLSQLRQIRPHGPDG